MTTSRARDTFRWVVLTAASLAAASILLYHAQPARPATSDVQPSFTRVPHAASAAPRAARSDRPSERYAYAWPLKPFREQHPVRGFFGDPRIADHGESRQFHFGIDISGPNGTPVYATLTGTASIHALYPTTVAIVGADGTEFSYWHVIPTIRSGGRVVAYRTVIGHIEAPYGHVHFSERRSDRYLNPLRREALGPFADTTRPWIPLARPERDGHRVGARGREPFDLVAEAYDETPLAIPRPWHDLPVTPALVRWRLEDASGQVVRSWATATDFRLTIPPKSAFAEIWAPGTTQNHVRAPGRYRIALARDLDLPAGRYVVRIAARDTRDNRVTTRFTLRVRAALSRP
jgi:hypothetical protein